MKNLLIWRQAIKEQKMVEIKQEANSWLVHLWTKRHPLECGFLSSDRIWISYFKHEKNLKHACLLLLGLTINELILETNLSVSI